MAYRKDDRNASRKPKHRPLFDEELNEAAASAETSYLMRERQNPTRRSNPANAPRSTANRTLRADVVGASPKKKGIVSALLTSKHTRGIVTVALAVCVAVIAIATVAASAVNASRDDDIPETAVTERASDTQNEEKSAPLKTAADTSSKKDGDDTKSPEETKKENASSEPEKKADDAADDPDKPDSSEESSKKDSKEKTGYTVTVKFYNAEDVTVSVDGGTVGEALAKAGVTLDWVQSQNVDLSEVITADTVVNADVVSYEYEDIEETIDYDTEYRESTDIPEGTTQVTQQGIEGKQTIRYNVMRVNGEEVAREQIGSWIDSYAQTEIITKGIAKPVQNVSGGASNGDGNASGNPSLSTVTVIPDESGEGGTIIGKDGVARHYIRCVDVSATCYYAGGTTAIGLPADENVIGVDPSVFAYWTQVYVAGESGDFGVRTVADTGWIEGYKIDICLNADNPIAQGFGWRPMKVYILG